MVRFKALVVGGAVAWLWLLGLAAGSARAGPFNIELSALPTPVAGVFQWNYQVEIGNGERIQTAGNTTTPQLPSSRPDFFIIYDFLGYVPGSIAATAPGWGTNIQNFTPIAQRPDQQVLALDDPNIPNLIFTKTAGTDGPGPLAITGFSARSVFGQLAVGLASAEFTNNAPGQAIDNTNNVGSVAVAIPTPEPATVVLMLAGPLFVLGAVQRGLRRRQARAAEGLRPPP